MYPTKSVKEFISKNDKELRYLVSSLSGSPVSDPYVKDIVQDFYFKAIKGNIIESYDPNFSRNGSKNPKMSTYLFPIINNLIKTTRNQPENRLQRNRFIADFNNESPPDIDEIELALQFNRVATDYEGVFYQNDDSDNTLVSDLKNFERKFLDSTSNKKFRLIKRKNKGILTKGLSLLDVYKHLKNGLSSREIAKIYGVSDMFICLLKKCIGKNITKYGVTWRPVQTYKKLPSEALKIETPSSYMKDWTNEDILKLREIYQTKSLIETAKEMGRSVCSIKSKTYKLGIKKNG
jgi:DNA-directed RNA polymerase specialized sigma24 family protein